MEFRDDTEVLFEVIDILADTPILKEIKEKENNTAIDIFMLLKKYDVLRKIIKVVSGKEPRGLLIVDSIKLFNHYSKLYKEIKKMI